MSRPILEAPMTLPEAFLIGDTHHEIDQIAVPTALLIGQKDTTAIGKERAPPEMAKALGNYPELGRQAHERIKGSVLVPFADLGHSPQVQDPARFNKALIEQLARM